MALNLLLSFAFYARDNLAQYRALMPCGRIMVDSGAFTAYTKGKVIGLDAYADFLHTWAGSYDTAVTLDVIGDPKATAANTRRLHERGLPVMPVFTRGGKLADFDAMVAECGYVCVGGGVGIPQALSIPRLAGLQRRAQDLGGGIHALGLGNMDGLRKVRPYSADASNISLAFRYGKLVIYDGKQVVIFSHSNHRQLAANLSHLQAQGVHPATIVRTGQHANGVQGRGVLMRGLSVAYACADEDTTGYQVPVPAQVADTTGCHLYSAIVGGFLARPAAELDTCLHDPDWSVPMWERYRAKHERQCRQLQLVQGVPA